MSKDNHNQSPSLQVLAAEPGFNAACIEQSGPPEHPEIAFAASPRGGPEALWFFLPLQITNHQGLTGLRFRIKHLDNMLGSAPMSHLYPAYRINNGEWKRLETNELITHHDGRKDFAWNMPEWGERVDVAVAPYYGLADLIGFLKSHAKHYQPTEIGVSTGELPLIRLANAVEEVGSERPGFYLIGRQHSGENTASWVMEGLLEALATSEPSPMVWAVPLADVDGVHAGLYGKDRFPRDFNRAWGHWTYDPEDKAKFGQQPMRHEIHCIQNDIGRWAKRCKPQLVLDMHAPSLRWDDGVFFFHRELDDEGNPPEADRPWLEGFRQALGEEFAALTFLRSNQVTTPGVRYPGGAAAGTFTRRALKLRGLTVEVPYGRTRNTILGIDEYREIGRRMASVMIDLSR